MARSNNKNKRPMRPGWAALLWGCLTLVLTITAIAILVETVLSGVLSNEGNAAELAGELALFPTFVAAVAGYLIQEQRIARFDRRRAERDRPAGAADARPVPTKSASPFKASIKWGVVGVVFGITLGLATMVLLKEFARALDEETVNIIGGCIMLGFPGLFSMLAYFRAEARNRSHELPPGQKTVAVQTPTTTGSDVFVPDAD